MKNLVNLKNEFNEIQKIKIFEIPAINKKTNEEDNIIFDIELQKNTLFAIHESLNSKQSKSKKISFVKIVLDPYFSLDENLQSLYEECINAILESEYFLLSDN